MQFQFTFNEQLRVEFTNKNIKLRKCHAMPTVLSSRPGTSVYVSPVVADSNTILFHFKDK